MESMIVHENLKILEWNDRDRRMLDDKYLQRMVHIALELADDLEDWMSFDYIMSKNRPLLTNHISLCGDVFTWKFKSRKKANCERVRTYLGSK